MVTWDCLRLKITLSMPMVRILHHPFLWEWPLSIDRGRSQPLLLLPASFQPRVGRKGRPWSWQGNGSRGMMEHTSDREKKSAFIDGNSFIYSNKHSERPFRLIMCTEHYGNSRGHSTKAFKQWKRIVMATARWTSNREVGRLGPALI